MRAPLARRRGWARALAAELTALRFALGDPRTPPAERIVLVLAYAFNPLDLIPDVIPVSRCSATSTTCCCSP